MLLPTWSQTLFRNGDCPYEIYLSPCPFRHGDSLYGYGDWCFCLPLSHGCAGAPPPKILAKIQNFAPCLCAYPTQRCRIQGLPYGRFTNPHFGTGTPHFHTGTRNDIDTRSNMGITRDYCMVTGIHTSPYGNGVSPFPYGDCKDINPRMEMGLPGITIEKRGLAHPHMEMKLDHYHMGIKNRPIPVSIQGLPLHNGYPFLYGDSSVTNPFLKRVCDHMGSRVKFQI